MQFVEERGRSNVFVDGDREVPGELFPPVSIVDDSLRAVAVLEGLALPLDPVEGIAVLEDELSLARVEEEREPFHEVMFVYAARCPRQPSRRVWLACPGSPP